ncbi:MAG: hypothetical protein POELPBGB_01934 [Bacteroidia bacterium]|nr:hypothetical protein [Bacteroidia bacterium]
MNKVKVSVNHYHKLAYSKLGVFVTGVKAGIYNHPETFSDTPFSEEEVSDTLKNYTKTYDGYKNRLVSKGSFKSACSALIKMLDTLAVYVNETAEGDYTILILSGFKPTQSSISSWLPPLQPEVKVWRSIELGEVYAESNKLVNAIYYGCVVFKNSVPEKIMIKPGGKLEFSNNENFVCIDITKSRSKKFINLTPEVMYYFYFYAANANGVSLLSEVKSIKCLKE